MSSRATWLLARSFGTSNSLGSRDRSKRHVGAGSGLHSLPLPAVLQAFDLARAGAAADWARQAGVDKASGRRFEELARGFPYAEPYLPRWKLESEETRRAMDGMFAIAKRYVMGLDELLDRKALALFADAMLKHDASHAGWDPRAVDALEFALRHSTSRQLVLTRRPLSSAKRAQHAVSLRSPNGVDISHWWADLIAVAIMVARAEHGTKWWPSTAGRSVRKKVADFINEREASIGAAPQSVADPSSEKGTSTEDADTAPQPNPSDDGHRPGRTPRRRRRAPTFAEASQAWIASLTRRDDYVDSIKDVFKYHLLPTFGTLPVGKISSRKIADFEARLRARPGRDGALGEDTVEKVMGHLSRFLTATCPRYKPRMRRTSRMPEKPAPVPQVLTPDQISLIRSHAPEACRDYIATGFATGMKTGELNGLQWQDIDLDAKVIRVRNVLVNGSPSACTKSSRRDVPMCDTLRHIFTRRHANRDPRTTLVFHTPNGHAIDDGNFSQRTWAPLLASLGLPKYPPRSMRSTAAAQMLGMGHSPSTVARGLGIKDAGAFKARYVGHLASQF